MPRRVTIPDEHVALILPNQLADELFSLLRGVRAAGTKAAALRSAFPETPLSDRQEELLQQRAIAGDVMLVMVEAKEV